MPTTISTYYNRKLNFSLTTRGMGYGSVGPEQTLTALYFDVSVSPVLFNFTLTPQTQLVRALALKPQRKMVGIAGLEPTKF